MLNLISKNRLKSYITILKTKDEAESLRAYYWNKALAASLYPALQCLEITLRNSIDIAIQKNPPHGKLYVVNDWWFTNITTYIGNKKIPKIDRIDKKNGYIKKFTWEENQIKKVKAGFKKKNIQYNASKIIAGLDFGFWTNFLSDSYEDTGSSTLLWPNLLSDVFPNAPVGINRKMIHDKINRIREFRNRISHHEPIWKFYYPIAGTIAPDYTRPVFGRAASISLLKQQFDEIIDLIRWIDKDRAIYLNESKICSSFIRICSENSLNAYLSPKDIPTIKITRTTKIGAVVKKIKKGEIFSITNNKNVVAIIGADIPIS